MALLAQVGTFTSPVSTTGNQTINLDSGIWAGASPKALIIFGSGLTADGFNTSFSAIFGAAVSSSKRAAIAARSWNGQGTSNTGRRHDNSSVVTYHELTPSIVEAADFVSFGANQFTINWTTSAAPEYIYNFICLGGAGVEADLIQFQSPTSTGTQNYSHALSGQPDAALFFSVNNSAAPPNSTGNAMISVGFTDFSTDFAVATRSETTASTSDTRRYQGAAVVAALSTTEILSELALASARSASNITLNWTTADATQRYVWALLLRGALAKVAKDTQKTSTGSKATTVGFSPNVCLLSSWMAPANASPQVDARLAIGALDNSGNQASIAHADEDGQGTTDADRLQDSDEALKMIDHNQSVLAAATGSYSGNDLSLNWTVADATAREFGGWFLGSAGGPWPHHLDNQGLTGGLSQLGI